MRTIEMPLWRISRRVGERQTAHSGYLPAKGFIQIDASRNEALKPPQPIIEQIALGGRVLLGNARRIDISPGSHELEAKFTAIRLGLAEGVRFRYRLDGLEQNWVETGAVRQAHYSHLPPGRLSFTGVRRETPAALGAEPASISIGQHPHVYQTWWFRFLLTGRGGGAGGACVRFRLACCVRATGAVLEERIGSAREFHDTLVGGLFGGVVAIGCRAAAL